MKVSHEHSALVTPERAFGRLQAFIAGRRLSMEPRGDMECFERELHEYFVAAEREVLAEELARLDVDLSAVRVKGELYRWVVRCQETYVSAAGPVQVMRGLYRRGRGEERTLCPLELRAGIVEGRWTPLAARQAAFMVAHLTPQEGEDLFRELGNMTPSKSSLDRLPKQLSARWEAKRGHYEAELRAKAQVPTEAVTLAVSLDGVMVPMKDGARAQKREESQAQDKRTCGPAGYSEVGCGTLTYYGREGNRLSTVRMARMPERHKAGLKAMLTQEIEAALRQRPDLGLVKFAAATRCAMPKHKRRIFLSDRVSSKRPARHWQPTDEALRNALASYRGAGHLDLPCPASKQALRPSLETIIRYKRTVDEEEVHAPNERRQDAW